MNPVTSNPAPAGDLTVICLCAEWCGACRDYRPLWSAHWSAPSAGALHLWVDIEDEADSLGELDIETFPTLLVLRGERPHFFGPVLPQIEVVDRILQSVARPGSVEVPIARSDETAIRWLVGLAQRSRDRGAVESA